MILSRKLGVHPSTHPGRAGVFQQKLGRIQDKTSRNCLKAKPQVEFVQSKALKLNAPFQGHGTGHRGLTKRLIRLIHADGAAEAPQSWASRWFVSIRFAVEVSSYGLTSRLTGVFGTEVEELGGEFNV
jgi:hypothetical protein